MKKFTPAKACIFAFLLLCGVQNLHSQIVCTDVNPDSTVTGNATLTIDVNNDNTPDFMLTSAQAGILSFVIVQANQIGTGNFVLANGANGALALAPGTPIGSGSSTWVQMNGLNQTMIQVVNGVGSGLWSGVSDQYLGLRFVVGLNTYYGWARFSFSNSSNTYVFKDYAYNSTPGQQILAGQSCGSINSPAINVSGNLCPVNLFTLTASTGTDIANTYTWSIIPFAGIIAAPAASVTPVLAIAAGVYTVQLTVTSGTVIGTTQTTINIQNFTPTITSNSPLCGPQALQLSASGGATYTWSLPGGTTMAATSITVASPVAGFYSVAATSAQGCTASTSSQVFITPLPTFTISPNTPSLCAGSGSVMYSISGTATQYSWSPSPANLAPNGQFASVSPASTTVYTITAGVNNCTTSATSTLTVIPSPSIAATGATLCLVQPATLTATLTPAAISYTWDSPNGSQFTVPSPTLLVSFNNVGVYTVTATSALGCQASTTVILSALPNPVFTLSPPQSLIFPGGFAPLTATGNTTLFSWSPPLGLSGTTGGTVFASPTVTTVYTVTASLNGCTATASSSVNIYPPPVLTLGGATVCVNEPAILTAGGASFYMWQGPNGFSSGVPNPTITATSQIGISVYTVTGVDISGCNAFGTVSLNVSACTGIAHEEQEQLFNLFPNPADERLYISTTLNTTIDIELSDASGKLLISQQKKPDAGLLEVNLETLPKGIYLLKINAPGQKMQVSRIIK